MTTNHHEQPAIGYAAKCLRDEAEALLGLIPLLNDDFVQTTELMLQSKGRVVVTGVGKSGHIGAKIAASLASTGTPAFFLNTLDAFHGDLGMITSEDVVLAISYSGATDELLRFVPYLLERHIPIVAMTGHPDSLLARAANYHLNIHVDREACPLNIAPTSSTTACLAMGDALVCALMQLRRFKAEDYAKFHPGGSLGKKLLSKVKDTMISTQLPLVNIDAGVYDTLIEISRGKLGIAVVLDKGQLAGVLTDGDVRRATQNNQEKLFQLTVKDIMTTSPKCIDQHASLYEAEKKMRQHMIHSLLVLNEEKQLVGIVDYFHCM